MSTISLPKLPTGKEFEEFVAAFFNAAGYYIDRNIVERDIAEVLELDFIVTDYNQCPPALRLAEAKSGGWGFADLFKMFGQSKYLNISSNGIFITKEVQEQVEFFKAKAKALSLDLIMIPGLEQAKKSISDYLSKTQIEDKDISAWRYVYWLERNLLKRLNHKKKSEHGKVCHSALEDYYFKVNSGIFFTETIADKVWELYQAFFDYDNISSRCGNEMIGNSFYAECHKLPQNVYEKTYYSCDYNIIQISAFIEHKARLSILKNAVDFILYKRAGEHDKADKISKILGIETSTLCMLPSTFKKALEDLEEHKFFYKYPVFWQWFIFVFGGFILKDYEENEYKLLSEKTGIPLDEIPNAFKAYQILFPLDGTWFLDLSEKSQVNLRLLKIFSVPFMGLGANYRRFMYTTSGKFEDLQITGEYTFKELIKWNNLLVQVLSESN